MESNANKEKKTKQKEDKNKHTSNVSNNITKPHNSRKQSELPNEELNNIDKKSTLNKSKPTTQVNSRNNKHKEDTSNNNNEKKEHLNNKSISVSKFNSAKQSLS